MPNDMLIAIAVGLFVQLIDGALGMAYGLTVSSILLSTGVPPAVSSAAVHVSEVFTTGASGFSHGRVGDREASAGPRPDVCRGHAGGDSGRVEDLRGTCRLAGWMGSVMNRFGFVRHLQMLAALDDRERR